MKIGCQLPICMPKEVYGGYYEPLMQDYNLFKDKETEVTIKDVPTGIIDPEMIPMWMNLKRSGWRDTCWVRWDSN